MKTLLLLIAAISLVGCAEGKQTGLAEETGPCSGAAFKGTWRLHPNGGDILSLHASCSGASTSCNQSFTFTMPDSNGDIIVTNTTPPPAPSCLPVGNTVCSINLSGVWFSIDCGAGTNTYQRQ